MAAGNIWQTLVRNNPHADSVVHSCEQWLEEHYAENGVIPRVVELANIPERKLKQRFKVATGPSLVERLPADTIPVSI
jgi:AraC-like DNA-binding protein